MYFVCLLFYAIGGFLYLFYLSRLADRLFMVLRRGEGRFIDFVPSIFLYLVLRVVGDGIC